MNRLSQAIRGLFESHTVQGPRVYLRPPRRSDASAWVSLRKESYAFLKSWEPSWLPENCTRSYFLRQYRRQGFAAREDRGYAFHIFRNADRALLGAVTAANVQRGVAHSASLGYWIGAPHARQGYMREAIAVLVPMLFGTLKLHRLEAAAVTCNWPSRLLLESLGFRCEGLARDYLKIDGRWQDHALYAMLATDPLPSPAAATDGKARAGAGTHSHSLSGATS
ncbi:MAG: GNAT family protein [Rhodospirillales bacterium]|nr:GNAT family protein [Rhodospirillales bacterium]